MDTDFVLNPFGAELNDLVAIARAADADECWRIVGK